MLTRILSYEKILPDTIAEKVESWYGGTCLWAPVDRTHYKLSVYFVPNTDELADYLAEYE